MTADREPLMTCARSGRWIFRNSRGTSTRAVRRAPARQGHDGRLRTARGAGPGDRGGQALRGSPRGPNACAVPEPTASGAPGRTGEVMRQLLDGRKWRLVRADTTEARKKRRQRDPRDIGAHWSGREETSLQDRPLCPGLVAAPRAGRDTDVLVGSCNDAPWRICSSIPSDTCEMIPWALTAPGTAATIARWNLRRQASPGTARGSSMRTSRPRSRRSGRC